MNRSYRVRDDGHSLSRIRPSLSQPVAAAEHRHGRSRRSPLPSCPAVLSDLHADQFNLLSLHIPSIYIISCTHDCSQCKPLCLFSVQHDRWLHQEDTWKPQTRGEKGRFSIHRRSLRDRVNKHQYRKKRLWCLLSLDVARSSSSRKANCLFN